MEGYPSKDRKMTTGDGQLSESLKMVFHSISSGSVKTGAGQDIFWMISNLRFMMGEYLNTLIYGEMLSTLINKD